ncbi:hypothetical protein ABPG72_005974 [Tetrahymena utriculariae]
MGDQDKETQSTKTSTLNLPEEKVQKMIAKLKELFEKENFKKNTSLIRGITNTTTNAVHLQFVLNEKSIAEIGVDYKQFEEILKKEELKSVIKFNPQEMTVAPVWKKLRNIIYINNIDKDIKNELQQQIEQDIKPHTIYYKLEQLNGVDSIKITINEPNQEETVTKALFEKLFFKKYVIGEKTININCAIEEEQFAVAFQQANPQQHPSHTFKVSHNNFPTTGINPHHIQQQQQHFLMMNMNQAMMQYLQKQSRQQFQRNKQQQNQNGRQYVNKNVNHLNNNAKSSGNNLYQPSNNNNNKSMNKQDRNNKSGKNSKGGNRQNPKQSQKVFNATEKDFPSLQ